MFHVETLRGEVTLPKRGGNSDTLFSRASLPLSLITDFVHWLHKPWGVVVLRLPARLRVVTPGKIARMGGRVVVIDHSYPEMKRRTEAKDATPRARMGGSATGQDAITGNERTRRWREKPILTDSSEGRRQAATKGRCY